MRRTNIYLDAAQTESLDRLAAQEGVSRAEVIRRLIDRSLAGSDTTVAADLVAIEESFGAIPDFEPVDRASGDREAHLTRVWRHGR